MSGSPVSGAGADNRRERGGAEKRVTSTTAYVVPMLFLRPYSPRWVRALRMGPLDTLMAPSRGWLISSTRKIAPAMEHALKKSTTTTVGFLGANSPKLMNVSVSQKTRTMISVIGSLL